jgi:hypothetical protein
MWFTSRFDDPIRGDARSPSRSRWRRRPAARRASPVPVVEALEVRSLLSLLIVTSGADAGPGSLRQVIASSGKGDTIEFAGNVHSITLTTGALQISRDLDIEGPGSERLTVSGNNASRVFQVASGAVATLAGLTVANGRSDQGAGIDNEGVLTLDHSMVANNRSDGGAGGGGVLNEVGATLTIRGGGFVSNRAYAGPGADVFGGGLLNLGIATINGAAFTSNQALGGGNPSTFFNGSQGGGIDNFGGASLTITRSSFVGNQVVGAPGSYAAGGAIENNSGSDGQSNPSTVSIDSTRFLNNLASTDQQSQGGGLDNEGVGAVMTISDSTLIGNVSQGTADGDSPGIGFGGGIMNAAGAILTVRESSLVGNQAAGRNGGTPTLDNQSIGGGIGGGILNSVSTATLDGCTLIGNIARGGASAQGLGGIAVGGGMDNITATVTVTHTQFLGNLAVAGPGGPGSTALGVGSAFGGGLDVSINSSGTVSDSTFIGNSAIGSSGGAGSDGGAGRGGALAVGVNNLFGFTDVSFLTLSNSTVTGNTASGGAGGPGADGGVGFGGGLLVSATGTAIVFGSSFTENQALGGTAGTGGSAGDGVGGGVYVYDLGVFAPIATVIKKNKASTSHDNMYPGP